MSLSLSSCSFFILVPYSIYIVLCSVHLHVYFLLVPRLSRTLANSIICTYRTQTGTLVELSMSQIQTCYLPSRAVLLPRKLIKQNESISYLKLVYSITQQGIGLVNLFEVSALKLLLLPRDLRQINCFKVVRGRKSWHSIHMLDLPKAHQCSASSYYNIEHATPGHFIVHLHLLVNSRAFDSATQLSISGSSCKPLLPKRTLRLLCRMCKSSSRHTHGTDSTREQEATRRL